jgi:hypothetical protein
MLRFNNAGIIAAFSHSGLLGSGMLKAASKSAMTLHAPHCFLRESSRKKINKSLFRLSSFGEVLYNLISFGQKIF